MGFGWLFIGYFAATLMTFNPLGFLIRLIGYGMVLAAACKLRRYQSAFGLVAMGTVLMLLVSLGLAVSDVGEYLYSGMLIDTKLVSDELRTALGHVERGALLVFTSLLLWAIRQIAQDTEVRKISDNAVRNMMFVGFYYVVYVIGCLPFAWVGNVLTELGVISIILLFVWIILNLSLIYSCYSHICDESDVEMARKPSRFAFVNRFREENDLREKRAMEDGASLRRASLERRMKRRKK